MGYRRNMVQFFQRYIYRSVDFYRDSEALAFSSTSPWHATPVTERHEQVISARSG